MKFEIYKSGNTGLLGMVGDQLGWRWRLKSSNGKIIASGEAYENKADCMHAIELVKGTDKLTPTEEVTG